MIPLLIVANVIGLRWWRFGNVGEHDVLHRPERSLVRDEANPHPLSSFSNLTRLRNTPFRGNVVIAPLSQRSQHDEKLPSSAGWVVREPRTTPRLPVLTTLKHP